MANVEFSASELKKIIRKTNACFVWGGSLGLAPADDKIIQVEKLLNLDPEAQLLASIMSKKLAVGADYIIIDIPYGKTAKVSKKKAEKLKRKFSQIAKYFKVKLKCLLTDGSQPIGNGIGPNLEMRGILLVLKNKGPQDLREKALFLTGELLELCKKAKKGEGYKLAEQVLSSGKAFKQFKKIIKAQGGKITKLPLGKHSYTFTSKKSGIVKEIDNKKLAYLARLAGCPSDNASGIYLNVHLNNKIKKKDNLLTIYSESKAKLKQAVNFYKKEKIINIH